MLSAVNSPFSPEQLDYINQVLGVQGIIKPEGMVSVKSVLQKDYDLIFFSTEAKSDFLVKLMEKMQLALKLGSVAFIFASSEPEFQNELAQVKCSFGVAFGFRAAKIINPTAKPKLGAAYEAFQTTWKVTLGLNEMTKGTKVATAKKQVWLHMQELLKGN